MSRAIVSLCATSGGGGWAPTLYAVASDGTAWRYDVPSMAWERLRDLPQPEHEAK